VGETSDTHQANLSRRVIAGAVTGVAVLRVIPTDRAELTAALARQLPPDADGDADGS
jgi:hypothetical protein